MRSPDWSSDPTVVRSPRSGRIFWADLGEGVKELVDGKWVPGPKFKMGDLYDMDCISQAEVEALIAAGAGREEE